MPCFATSRSSLHWRLESTPCHFKGSSIGVNVSFGIEAYGPKDSPEELLRRADLAMYYVKRAKKRVVPLTTRR